MLQRAQGTDQAFISSEGDAAPHGACLRGTAPATQAPAKRAHASAPGGRVPRAGRQHPRCRAWLPLAISEESAGPAGHSPRPRAALCRTADASSLEVDAEGYIN